MRAVITAALEVAGLLVLIGAVTFGVWPYSPVGALGLAGVLLLASSALITHRSDAEGGAG